MELNGAYFWLRIVRFSESALKKEGPFQAHIKAAKICFYSLRPKQKNFFCGEVKSIVDQCCSQKWGIQHLGNVAIWEGTMMHIQRTSLGALQRYRWIGEANQ